MSHQLPELLPCPFCGGDAICIQVFEKPMPRFGCSACGMFKLSSTAWNTRAIASVKREPLSNDELRALARAWLGGYIGFARAVERFHGIGATTASREPE